VRKLAEGDDASLGSALAVKQDCPPNMARCVEGAVEVSEGRATCPTCPCAWRRVGACDAGCAAETVELAREPLDPATLCRSDSTSFARLPDPSADGGACPTDARFFCGRGVIFACPPGAPGVAVNVCTFGCEREDESLDEPNVDIAAATSLLCRRHRTDSGVAAP